MSNSTAPFVVIGTGLAGYNLVKELRKLAPEQEIIMITADDGRNYSKPMLSTGFGKNKSADELAMGSAADMAAQLNIVIRTHTSVTKIDTAILFGELDLFMIGLLQVLNLMCLWLAAGQLALSWAFYLALALGALFLAWQLWNVRSRSREDCFTEFRRSHWFGLIIWLGLVGHYALES